MRLQSKESKFFLSHIFSVLPVPGYFGTQNLQPNRFMPRILLTESVKSRREFGREQTANGEQKKKREFY
jgi:hypothetical protein